MEKHVWVVMPAYNEESSIGEVIDGLHRQGFSQLIVVDDGSKDQTGRIARSKGAEVVTHDRNRGLGSALRTGFREARNKNAEIVVTFDSDGQHDPKAIPKLLDALNDSNLAIGIRYRSKMPWNKRLGNSILDVITRLFGGPLTDSQSGFRALDRVALKNIRIRSNLYEVSSEILIQAREKNLKIKGVPIQGIFTEYSEASGTTIASGIRIFLNLFKQKIERKI